MPKLGTIVAPDPRLDAPALGSSYPIPACARGPCLVSDFSLPCCLLAPTLRCGSEAQLAARWWRVARNPTRFAIRYISHGA